MNEELTKQFAVKNIEIFKNKLIIDIDNNNESLSISLNNILNLMFEDAKNNLLEIFESILYKEKIELYINKIKTIYISKTNEILTDKKNDLLEFINKLNVDSIPENIYRDRILLINDKIFSAMDELLINEIDKIILNIPELENNEFLKGRYIDFFLRFKNLLKEKLKMQMFDRDNNLINNFNESYKKYIDINNSTSNIV